MRKQVILAGFILALWLATHPYMGVVHDARLYLIQTLQLIDPANWRDDLFFKYGTQGSYSIFSNGYRFLVSALGISRADQVALLAGSALWLAGLSALTCTILKRPNERIAAACGIIAFSTGYGGLNIFHYSEPFVTPRLFAEAAVMGSLALAIQGRYVWGSALIFLALIIHPLMAISGIGILAVHILRQHRWARIALSLALLISMVCVGLAIGPFARARELYDTTWFQIVEQRNSVAMISAWSAADYARMIATFLALGAFLTVASARELRFIISLLVAATLSCTVSFLGADLIHNVLITNIQLWRIMWIVSLASNALILLLLLRSSGTDRWALTVAATFSFLPQFLLGLSLVAPFFVILCLLWVLRKKLPSSQARAIATWAILILAAISLVSMAIALYLQITADHHLGQHLSSLTLAATILLGLGLATRRSPNKWLGVLVAITLAASVARLDQRTPWNRYVYEPESDVGFSKFLANSGQTYWEGMGTEALWFKARKQSYYSCVQGSESIFFRAEALEWSRRESILKTLNTADFDSDTCGLKIDPDSNGPSSRLQMIAACKELPDLNTIILNHPVPGLPEQHWTAPTYQRVFERDTNSGHSHQNIVKISTFYRYNCTNLRDQ